MNPNKQTTTDELLRNALAARVIVIVSIGAMIYMVLR